MKGRWIGVGAVLGFALALTLGFTHGPRMPVFGPGQGESGGTGSMDAMWTAMDEMHDSPPMQDLHARMPAELRAQCEAVHGQMSQMMQGMGGMGSMAGGMGGMAGPVDGMGPGSHASHHSTTTGG